jgi:hypothetical protein
MPVPNDDADDNPLADVLRAMAEADGVPYEPAPPTPAQRAAWARVRDNLRRREEGDWDE